MHTAQPNTPSPAPVPQSAGAVEKKRLPRGALIATFPEPQDISGDGLLTLRETCGVLRSGVSKVYTLINAGELKSVMIRGTRRVTKESVRHDVENGAPVC